MSQVNQMVESQAGMGVVVAEIGLVGSAIVFICKGFCWLVRYIGNSERESMMFQNKEEIRKQIKELEEKIEKKIDEQNQQTRGLLKIILAHRKESYEEDQD